ncbi:MULTISPECIES: SAM-dependent methyltransferase [Streptomyces]|uniref:Cyclopropane-fatty-acyl-phospholipid synthase n=1 Tax=Streptomyces virginiae TaxID=1961 RepID=A0ABQ3NWJ5_STRVG|nr:MULTISPECIES: cyclopropane-fatty-acyl-phospholipid synthase family protein [Streptomyces]KOU25474.1 cyclopropane-fatty-acyl-phospholipid synthase [Streptomyces sp. WM6349]KOV06559.1 cyclopropane-fatty-acyl-phospholipid synthase [Streptomyces sp. XY533]KOV15022.1 cyclopropane-fatty-acyl-phospholipid synthase [Streptomyces sp. XY511]KOV44866.1 cyclopropane-fatty-acyl-phospholipid synthase [Streptomyces sp. H036]MBP2344491.1 cyclopropane-fatty-acyl-phospholipid synthase [Streptomyces virginiae
MTDAAPRLAALAETLLGGPLPVRIRAWDGSEAGPPDGPVLVVRGRRALRRMLWKPGELGLARAWVAGDLTVDGDLFELLDRVAGLLWERDREPVPAPTPGSARLAALRTLLPRRASAAAGTAAGTAALLRDAEARGAVRDLVTLARPLPAPPPPPEEAVRRGGPRHTRGRDRQAVSHHYDVGNDFYERVLGPSMVYSCAYWTPGSTLERAQHDKLDLVCRKLALKPGDRLLDVGCGWGSLALHAAREYGARVTGVTLSREQAAYARKKAADEGLADLVEIRIQDYRDVKDGPYDAISSIGMAEHVGADRYRDYARTLHALLRPGGLLLNHQIARPPEADEAAYRVDEFIDAYVFPDGELSPVGTTVGELERAGFEVRDVEALREHYALTLRAWVARLEEHWDEAVALTSAGRVRVWQLYMAASALGFERGRLGVNQVLAVRSAGRGDSGLPLRLRTWGAQPG